MKKVYIGFAFSHHKNSLGGYHHIKEYLHYFTIINAQWEKEFYESTSSNLIFRFIRRVYILILGQGTPFSVIRCIFLALFRKNQVFHFIHPENSYKWLHNFTNKTNNIVCTFHQPASFFLEHPLWIKLIKKIDIIILLTEKDVSLFRQWTGKENVFFIPHGVNCSYFFYNPNISKKQSILMVGNWLRDFELARKVFQIIIKVLPEVEINVVTRIENYIFFRGLKVSLYSNISDDDLRNMYQLSKIVFFPLKQYSANNAILEAASCGCNILISVPDNFDTSYFSDDFISFCDCDVDKCASILMQLLNVKNTANSRIISNYVKERYDWNIIAKRTEEILDNLNKQLHR